MLYNSTATAEVNQAWGEWLSGLAKWDWWVTLTFADPPANTSGWTRPGWATAKKGWREFVNHVHFFQGIPCKPLTWVRGFEIQKWRGAPHIHALIGNIAKPRIVAAGTWWEMQYGRIWHIEKYNPSLGAGFYLCKYVTKEMVDFDWGGLDK